MSDVSDAMAAESTAYRSMRALRHLHLVPPPYDHAAALLQFEAARDRYDLAVVRYEQARAHRRVMVDLLRP